METPTLVNDEDLRQHFAYHLGIFHASWTAAEADIDLAIGKFLQIPHRDALMITSGMEYGKKIRLLRDLVARSNHSKKAEILGALKYFENESNRNIFSHSYLLGNSLGPVFLNKKPHGELTVKLYEYTHESWAKHVADFTGEAYKFSVALGFSADERNEYIDAALSMLKSSSTSPTPPDSNSQK